MLDTEKPNPLTNAAATVTGSWSMCCQAGVHCDKTLGPDGSPCQTAISIGAPMWLEEHLFSAPTLAHRSYAVVTCEQCRLLEIAHEWADAGDVPAHAIHKTNRRGLAGKHMLTPDQYERTCAAATTMILAAPARSDVPDAPVGDLGPETLAARESRKVRRDKRDNRHALAG
jgi:hypothetical protein